MLEPIPRFAERSASLRKAAAALSRRLERESFDEAGKSIFAAFYGYNRSRSSGGVVLPLSSDLDAVLAAFPEILRAETIGSALRVEFDSDPRRSLLVPVVGLGSERYAEAYGRRLPDGCLSARFWPSDGFSAALHSGGSAHERLERLRTADALSLHPGIVVLAEEVFQGDGWNLARIERHGSLAVLYFEDDPEGGRGQGHFLWGRLEDEDA